MLVSVCVFWCLRGAFRQVGIRSVRGDPWPFLMVWETACGWYLFFNRMYVINAVGVWSRWLSSDNQNHTAIPEPTLAGLIYAAEKGEACFSFLFFFLAQGRINVLTAGKLVETCTCKESHFSSPRCIGKDWVEGLFATFEFAFKSRHPSNFLLFVRLVYLSAQGLVCFFTAQGPVRLSYNLSKVLALFPLSFLLHPSCLFLFLQSCG